MLKGLLLHAEKAAMTGKKQAKMRVLEGEMEGEKREMIDYQRVIKNANNRLFSSQSPIILK